MEIRADYEASPHGMEIRADYEASPHGMERKALFSASRSFSSRAELSLDQIEVPRPEDLHNACTDLTTAYMLFCERSGQFMNREADYIHTVWGDDANEKDDLRQMLKLDPEQIPELLRSNSHIVNVVDRIGKPLTDADKTDIINFTRSKGYDQSAVYLNCSCCGMGNYFTDSKNFNRVNIPTRQEIDSSIFISLVLSKEEIAEYLSHGVFKCVFNVYQHPFEENLFLYLIPRFCEVDQKTSIPFTIFCKPCFQILRVRQLPKFCVKNCDLMDFLAFPDIKELSTLELLILSPIRLYGLKYLICENGKESFSFSGHCIAVPQDGPDQLCKVNFEL